MDGVRLGDFVGLFKGLVVIAVVIAIAYAVFNLLITTGIIANTSPFYTQYESAINALSNLITSSLDILKIVVIVALLAGVLYFVSGRMNQ